MTVRSIVDGCNRAHMDLGYKRERRVFFAHPVPLFMFAAVMRHASHDRPINIAPTNRSSLASAGGSQRYIVGNPSVPLHTHTHTHTSARTGRLSEASSALAAIIIEV